MVGWERRVGEGRELALPVHTSMAATVSVWPDSSESGVCGSSLISLPTFHCRMVRSREQVNKELAAAALYTSCGQTGE